MLELARRVGLALSLVLAALAWSWVESRPFVNLSLPRANRRAPQATRLVSGPGWEALYADALAVGRGSVTDPALSRRILAYGHRSLTYRLDEPPVAALADGAFGKNGSVRLVLDDPARGASLDATIGSLDWDDFHLGSGLSAALGPSAMRFPWRHLAWLPPVFGLIAYLILPHPRRPAGVIHYPGWRVVLTDVVWLLLFVPFFALPLLIVGAVQPALLRWPLLTAMFWLLSTAGLILLGVAAWYAVFAVELSDTALHLTTLTGRHTVPFTTVASFSRVRHRAPVWLVRALWLLSALGRGNGQAMLLSLAETGGLALALRDGGRVYFWITDTLGTTALSGAQRIEAALRAAGVPFAPKVEERRDFWPPTFAR